MSKTDSNKLKALTIIAADMNIMEIDKAIDLLKRLRARQEVSKLVDDFMVQIRKLDTTGDGWAYVFIPQDIWEQHKLCKENAENHEPGKYFALLPENFKGIIDENGIPVLKAID